MNCAQLLLPDSHLCSEIFSLMIVDIILSQYYLQNDSVNQMNVAIGTLNVPVDNLRCDSIVGDSDHVPGDELVDGDVRTSDDRDLVSGDQVTDAQFLTHHQVSLQQMLGLIGMFSLVEMVEC